MRKGHFIQLSTKLKVINLKLSLNGMFILIELEIDKL